MDALHLIRAAAEFADALERDAQNASAAQLTRTEEEIRRRQHELQQREREVERFREESERQRDEIVNAAKAEARELLANANARRDDRAARGRGAWRPAARAGAPPGDRADERRPRRGRADARVGARAGRIDPARAPAGRRAAALRRRPRRPTRSARSSTRSSRAAQASTECRAHAGGARAPAGRPLAPEQPRSRRPSRARGRARAEPSAATAPTSGEAGRRRSCRPGTRAAGRRASSGRATTF